MSLVQNYKGFKRAEQIRVLHEDIKRMTLGMMGDATRFIETVTDEDGTTLYRVEDVRDAAGQQWNVPIGDLERHAPVKQAKKGSHFHYTTKAGVEHILKGYGTRQSRAVQQLMD